MFADNHTNDLPEFIAITNEQVEKYWDDWLIWRSLGRRNNEGAFEPAISYVEAMQSVPAEELTVFIHLDSLYAKMEAQYIKQTQGRR